MGNRNRITIEDYYTLMWWAVKGFRAIQCGEPPHETATKYIDGITELINEIEKRSAPSIKERLRKLCRK